jgi:hypothetical protein
MESAMADVLLRRLARLSWEGDVIDAPDWMQPGRDSAPKAGLIDPFVL